MARLARLSFGSLEPLVRLLGEIWKIDVMKRFDCFTILIDYNQKTNLFLNPSWEFSSYKCTIVRLLVYFLSYLGMFFTMITTYLLTETCDRQIY